MEVQIMDCQNWKNDENEDQKFMFNLVPFAVHN